jgi:hypothetical protein
VRSEIPLTPDAILWYLIAALIFILYCVGVFQREPGIYYAIQRIRQNWFTTINMIVFLIFLLPGIAAYKLYERLSKPKASEEEQVQFYQFTAAI